MPCWVERFLYIDERHGRDFGIGRFADSGTPEAHLRLSRERRGENFRSNGGNGNMTSNDKFCAGCGTRLALRQHEGQTRPVCPACGRVVYYDPKLATACVIERDGETLMVRRAVQTGYGLWSMPGGYVDRGEPVEEAAAREVWEETGLLVEVGQLIGVFSDAGNPVVVAAYAATETGGVLAPGPESLDVGYFAVDALPPLAFPRDEQIIRRWRAMKSEIG